jgi:hypothetical protein
VGKASNASYPPLGVTVWPLGISRLCGGDIHTEAADEAVAVGAVATSAPAATQSTRTQRRLMTGNDLTLRYLQPV